ncbi:MAG: haloalkane dehalogenase [Pseudomonadota bacterium]
MPIDAIRTPEEAFQNLPGFAFQPHYLDDLPGYEGLRIHYLDEGAGPRTYLCLHGQPTWCYLYRRMIPVFAAAGYRVVAPDLLGFGRSDKPLADEIYTFDFHRRMLLRFVERLDGPITLVCQDWGGILGLTLPMEVPQIDRLLVMNTTLATGVPAGEAFEAWRQFVASQPDFPISGLMRRGAPHLTEAEAAAYDAPFPDARYRAGARRFPELVATRPDMEGADTAKAAKAFFQNDWNGKTFVAIGEQDPVLGSQIMEKLARLLGCETPMRVADGGHFLQEWGEEIAERAVAELA